MILSWPLFALVDERGAETGYACLQAPPRTPEERHAVDLVSKRRQLIGFTSLSTFPAYREPGDDRNYASLCSAWCHCFREPDRYLPFGKPRALISYSDFTDYSLVSSGRLPDHGGRKDFDFVYVCQPGRWKEQAKNWQLAHKCLPVLCGDLGLRGVLVGRAEVPDLRNHGERLTILPELPWRTLMTIFLRSRFLFVPNELDPSPRIIAEALCMNIPVLVNRHILGGWTYVNSFTGAFFESERDVAAGARICLEDRNSPRRWYAANYGPLNTGRRLIRFLAELDPNLRKVRRVFVTDKLNVHDPLSQ